MRLSLRGKIMLSYTALVVISVAISSVVFLYSRDFVTNSSMRDIALESIQADNRTFVTTLQYLRTISKTMIANQLVQSALTDYAWESDSRVMRYVMETVSLDPLLSSAYLLRPDGVRYYSDKSVLKPMITYEALEHTPLYATLAERNGGYLVARNAGGLIDDGTQYLSFMRVINSLKTLRPIGLMCINLRFDEVFNPRHEQMEIVDGSDGMTVLWNNVDALVNPSSASTLFAGKDVFSAIRRGEKGSMVLVGIRNPDLDMTFVRCIPVYSAPLPILTYTTIIALTILLNALIFIFGSVWISSFISRPIKNLIESMEGVYQGNFNTVTAITSGDEIGRLQAVYNTIIDKIQRLIADILAEQKALRRAELEITIAQINPHFLYNTLNTINSLAVMGKTREVSETIKALGDFYKSSLNNGEELITLEKELESIQSYMYIQQLRYAGLFHMKEDVQPEALGVRVPKMILQPLVENAIYHGVRQSVEEDGLITIRARVDASLLTLEVTDNGLGMSSERLVEVRRGKSIGLGATMRRIAILCGDTSEFAIESAPGEGTTVRIRMTREL